MNYLAWSWEHGVGASGYDDMYLFETREKISEIAAPPA
jgi:hypothetical protein